MPVKRQIILSDDADSFDLDRLPQPVVGYGRDLDKGDILPYHHHLRTQLVYASEGVMTVKTNTAAYLIPPQRAVWMPGGTEHQIEARSAVRMRTLYIEAQLARSLKSEICVLEVSPLLRELIVEMVTVGLQYSENSPESRLVAVILDQVKIQSRATSLALPMPQDSRLQAIVKAIIDDPANSLELEAWAQRVGASVRTLVRLFPAETGMSFRQWRQQRRLLRALELLAEGVSVTAISLELGYDSSSAFIAMFRRSLGTTPARYLSD